MTATAGRARGPLAIDPWLVLTSLLLVGYGFALIYSGSLARFGDTAAVLRGPMMRQAMYLTLGIGLMLVLSHIDYRLWRAYAPILYALCCVLLAVVLVVGTKEFGSRRWITIGGFQFQPSEPAKLVTIVLLSRIISGAGDRGLSLRTFMFTLVLMLIPAALVFKEPDLGTAVVFLMAWVGLVYIGGVHLRHLGLLAALGVAALPFVMLVVIHGYQKERLAIFFDPKYDPLGAGFNVNQATISIGSGGLTGKGFTQGTQTQLDFLRTQTTDYIFSVLGEELGFAGAMVLFILYLLLLLRGLYAAVVAPDAFGRLVATGIVVMIVTQIFINIGVNVRLFPVTGIPLPFISQGGSSLMSMFMAVGMLQSVLANRRPKGTTVRKERYIWPGR